MIRANQPTVAHDETHVSEPDRHMETLYLRAVFKHVSQALAKGSSQNDILVGF